jgi:GT2 family glycosyltransferase
MPKVSIIIVNWNGLKYLPELMKSLAAQSFTDFETIVVDNGSKDGSVDWLRDNCPEARVLPQKSNLGFCAGNNVGIRQARGEYLFLLNNDTVVRPDAIKNMLSVIEEKGPDCIGVFPKVLFYDEPYVINAFGVIWNYDCQWKDIRVGLLDFGQFTEPERVFGSIFAAVIVRREQFVDMGMFDERFFTYGEDFDVCYRANLMGYTFYTVPDAEVLHKYRGSSVEKKRPSYSNYLYIRNYLMAIFKNYSAEALKKYMRHLLRRYVWSGVKHFARTGQPHMVWSYVRAVMGLAMLAPHIKRQRRIIQPRRKVPDYELWNWSTVEGHNILHYQAYIVLSLGNIASTFKERREYEVHGQRFSTY